MSSRAVDAFVLHGVRGVVLQHMDAQFYALPGRETIAVYDIGDEKFFGALYPDGARIAVLKTWFVAAQRIYEQLRQQGKLIHPALPEALSESPPPVPPPRIKVRPRKKMIKVRGRASRAA